jgi:hypothetical protein
VVLAHSVEWYIATGMQAEVNVGVVLLGNLSSLAVD